MDPINVAVIGSGFMGAAHIDSLRRVPGINVVAISSIDRPRAEELADHFAIPHVIDDWREIASHPEVAAVHNCTPNNLHFEVNRVLIEAGKHVLSEKPLTMTSAESGELRVKHLKRDPHVTTSSAGSDKNRPSGVTKHQALSKRCQMWKTPR